jgi:hypothetical protein
MIAMAPFSAAIIQNPLSRGDLLNLRAREAHVVVREHHQHLASVRGIERRQPKAHEEGVDRLVAVALEGVEDCLDDRFRI